MTDLSQAELERDEQLGLMLREALAPHHEAAFLVRLRARLGKAQRARSWDEELARWFWRGLAAATAVVIMAGLGLTDQQLNLPDDQVVATEASFAGQLLQGRSPGVEVFLVTMRSSR